MRISALKCVSPALWNPVLIRFRVENFRSIKEAQEFSLVAAPLSEHTHSLVHIERYDLDLLRTAAIYGPNASGKSSVIAAFRFMREAVVESQTKWRPDAPIPRVPFALSPKTVSAPSHFSVDLLIDAVRYEYGLVIDSERVLKEWLFAFPKGRRQEWFTRDANRTQEFVFSRFLSGENRSISGFTRPNSLFLSAAAQSNHPMLAPIYRWFAGFWIVDSVSRNALTLVTTQLCLEDNYKTSIMELLSGADLGITGMDVEEEDLESFASRMNRPPDDPELLQLVGMLSGTASGVQLRHRAGQNQTVALPLEQESEGTRTLFGLSAWIVAVLQNGWVLAVDELDRSLHPHLALQIVALFNDPAVNRRNAQLVFNTHDTNLLDTSVLRRDQIWFTEKGEDGGTRLFPLTDFRARKYENIERGYLQGRYGAVPSIRKPDLLWEAAG
jgi:hypothetical protein